MTDAVVEEVQEWQNRPLERIYPILYLDALFVKMRHEGRVENRAVYVVLGVGLDGVKDVLGLWVADTEGPKFWLRVVTELRNRGVQDVFIACVDGLKGFPEAIEAIFPKAQVQLCIVHLIRNSLKYVNDKERKNVALELKTIYSAPTAEAAEQELNRFEEKQGARYRAMVSQWRRNWERITPFFAFVPEVRKVIYTTNAIESLNRSLRKIIKTRGAFPNEQSAVKLIYLALKNVTTSSLCCGKTEFVPRRRGDTHHERRHGLFHREREIKPERVIGLVCCGRIIPACLDRVIGWRVSSIRSHLPGGRSADGLLRSVIQQSGQGSRQIQTCYRRLRRGTGKYCSLSDHSGAEPAWAYRISSP